MKRLIYLSMAIVLLIGLRPAVTAAQQPKPPDPAAPAPAGAGVEGIGIDYGWSQGIGAYTEITGGTVVTTSCDDESYNNIALPFGFTFNGTAYTSFSIQCNGFLAMGPTVADSTYGPLSSGTTNNVISALGTELQTGTANSDVRYEVLGTSPDQVLVVQYKNLRNYGATGDSYNFQIRLYETGNVVEVVYGEFVKNTTNWGPQVGLRGSSTADFNNRKSSTGWTNTVAGTVNTAYVLLSTAYVPPSGLTWTWTPLAPHPIFDTSTKTATAEVSAGGDIDYTVVIKNTGSADAAAATMVDPIPAGAAYNGDVACDAGACTYNDVLDQVEWSGSVPMGGQVTVAFSANTAGLSCWQVMTNAATMADPNLYGGPVTRSADTQIVGLINHLVLEGFELGVPPAGWTETIVNDPGYPDPDWSRVIADPSPELLPHGGTYMAQFNSKPGSGASARLATYALDFTNVSLPRVLFWMSHDPYRNEPDRLQIQVSTDNGQSWSDVGAPVMRYDRAYTAPGWGLHAVSLEAYAGQPSVLVGFLGINGVGRNVNLDDVSIQDACGHPMLVLWPDGAGSACPGTSIDYTLDVKNVSFDPDTIDLDVSGYAWPASVVPASLDLGPNETGQAVVTVQVPWGAARPEGDAATVTATAQGTGETGSATVTTAASAHGWAAAMQDMAVGGEPSLYWGGSYYYDGEVCVVGGLTGSGRGVISGEHWCYDIAGGTRTQKASMPIPRMLTAYGLIGSKFYMAGGQDNMYEGYTDLQIYDITTDTWSTGAPLPTARGGQAGGVVNGKLYSAGGQSHSYPTDCPTYEYDPVADAWATRASCPLQKGYGFFRGGSVGSDTWGRLFAGGWSEARFGWYAFDPAANTWQTLSNLPINKAPLMVENPLTGDIYSIGGFFEWMALGQIWKYDYPADTWTKMGVTLLTAQGGSLGPAHGSFGDPDLQGFWTLGGSPGSGSLTPSPFEFWQSLTCPAAAPDIEVTPTSLNAEQCPDTVTTQALQVCNTGVAPLEWSLEEEAGGPDPSGYTFQDSLQPGGPAYDWVEIAPPAGGSGTALGLYGDDAHFWPLNLPWAFPFYGTNYTQIAPTTNGQIYFQPGYNPSFNTAIPSTLYPYPSISHFWDDMDVVDWTGEIYYRDLGDGRFVLEYYTVNNWWYGTGTWEVILYQDGRILMQYQDTDFHEPGFADYGLSASVGIQQNGTAGLQYSYGSAVITDGKAILFRPPGIPWLTESPAGGTLAPGECAAVTVTFDSTDMGAGGYAGNLRIDSNDLDEPAVTVPVQMTVQGCGGCTWVDLLADDFEGGFGNWTMDGLWNPENEADACGSLVAPFPSSTFDAYYGVDGACNYDVGLSAGSLTLAYDLDLGAAEAATLDLWSWEQTQCGGACYSGRRLVEVSTDGGATWATIASLVTENTWYNAALHLGAYAGGPLRLRFRFDSMDVGYKNRLGWMVDNVTVRACMADEPNIRVQPASLAAEQCSDAQTTETLQICSNGSQPLEWSLVEDPPLVWLAQSTTGGTLAPGECADVTVTFDSGVAPGAYTGALDINSNDPDTPQVTVPVQMTVPAPAGDAGFDWAPPAPFAGEAVTFNGWAGGSEPLTYEWTFGDGNSGAGPLVSHAYATPGDYPVTLTVSNDCGSVSLAKTVPLLPPPDIDVTPPSLLSIQYPDTQAEQTLHVCNRGGADLAWNLVEQPAEAGGIESLSGSYVAFDPSAGGAACYNPGRAQTFCFRAESYTDDYEYRYGTWLKFPAGWTVTDAYVAGTPVCDSGTWWSTFEWSFETEPYEVKIDHHVSMEPTDHCVATYCFDVVTGGGGGAPASWYWDGDGYGNAPHHPCSSDQYTPASMAGEPCDEWVNPQAEVPLCDIPWLSEDPASGTLAPGACADVTATFDSTGMAPGAYTGALDIGSNDPDEPGVEVPAALTVVPPNQAPVLDPIGDQAVDELAPLAFAATAADPDEGDTLTYGLEGAVPEGAAIDPATGAFSWTPGEDQGPGDYPFTVKVCDDATPSACDQEEITITVNEVNQAPELGAIGNQTVDEETLLTFSAAATDADLPANTLTFSLEGAPDGAAIDPGGDFGWTPGEDQGGADYTFTVRVCDDGAPSLCDEETITVTVADLNAAPVLDPIGERALMWGNELSFTVTASDPDLPANTLTLSLEGAPDGSGFDTDTGLFSWTPSSDQIGSFTLTFRVTDDGDPVMWDEETITVDVGKRATLLVYGGDASAQYSDPAALQATLTDDGGGSLQGTPLPGKTVGFVVGSQSTSGTTGDDGVAVGSITLGQAAGTPGVTSSFAEDALYLASADADPFEILKESAELGYTGDTLVSTKKPGGSATVNLAASVQEALDGALGAMLNTTSVQFTLDNGATCAAQVGGVANGKGTATCSVSLKAGNYVGNVALLVNGYYFAQVETVAVTVTDPGAGLATGGGWLTEPVQGTRANFGFTVKFLKNGSVQGNSIYIYRHTADIGYGLRDYNWIVKSNAMIGLQITNCVPGQPSGCQAKFGGKSTIKAVDRETGAVYNPGGNYNFQVDVTDLGEPGAQAVDTYALRVWDGYGTYYQVGDPAAQVLIAGGNIQVRAKK